MRQRFASILLIGLTFLLISGRSAMGQASGQMVKWDCAPILQKMRSDFATDPGRLVLALEDALTTNEICACLIIRTAVDLAGRDPAVCSEILIAAIRLIPNASAQMTECLLREAPETASVIRVALARELGDTAPALLLENQENAAGPITSVEAEGISVEGKQPAPARPAGSGVPLSPSSNGEDSPTVSVTGMYFVFSASPAAATLSQKLRNQIFIHPAVTTATVPRRPVSPVSRSDPE